MLIPGRRGVRVAVIDPLAFGWACQEELVFATDLSCLGLALIEECGVVAVVETRPPRQICILVLVRDGILYGRHMAVSPLIVASERHRNGFTLGCGLMRAAVMKKRPWPARSLVQVVGQDIREGGVER